MVQGDFFDEYTIPRGADTYILKQIIHDWTDADAVRILKSIRHSMPATAKLLIIERVMVKGTSTLLMFVFQRSFC